MAFRIAEYACGPESGRAQSFGPGANIGLNIGSSVAGPIQCQFSTGLSTGATPNFVLSAGTRMILIDTDQGALVVFGSSIASTSAPLTVTSTNGQHIPVNVAPMQFFVQPGQKLFVAST